MGRATVAALTDIFRVVWWDGLFVVDDARKGARTFVREKTREATRVKHVLMWTPQLFGHRKSKLVPT